MNSSFRWTLCAIVIFALGFVVEGCHTTNLRVESQPPGATVHYDYKPVGTTPVEFPVDWYGKHKLTLAHPDYGQRVEYIDLESPMYMKFPLDFFATVIPAPIKDNHTIHIDLTEPATQSVEEENGSEGTRPEKE